MNKTVLRIVLASFFLLLSGGSFFAVLAVEENRRLVKIQTEQEKFLASVRGVEQARLAYFESVAQSSTASRQEMAAAKSQYEALLKDQPSLIQKNQKQATTTVEQLVPVASSSNVTRTQTSKPKSTRTTKTS